MEVIQKVQVIQQGRAGSYLCGLTGGTGAQQLASQLGV